MALTKVKAGNILLTTPGASSNDVTPATTQYVTTALANLADSAPSTLNTLNELAAALGDDANFSTTVTNSIAAKLPLAGGTMTGGIITSGSNTGTNPAANGHIANELQFFNASATDNNLNGIGFYNSNSAVDARIAGVHKSHSSRHGEIAFLTHDGTALTERVRFDKDGNVGIGMTPAPVSSDTVLSIYNTATPRIKLHNNTTGSASGDGAEINMSGSDFILENREAGNVRLFNNGAERMRIDSSGKVMIGSTNTGVGGAIDFSVGSTSSSGGITLWSPTNGTHSLGFGDGYTGTDRYRGYVEYAHNGDSMRFATASTERMRIDSVGNVGIGTSSPSYKLQVSGTGGTRMMVENTDTNWAAVDIRAGGNQANYIFFKDDSAERARITVYDSDAIAFSTGNSPTIRMTLDSTGRLAVGGTATSGSSGGVTVSSASSGYRHMYIWNSGMYFWNGANEANLSSGGAWNNASDERLKENITDIPYGLAEVKQLQPKKYSMITGGEEQVGLIAQEVETIIPELVTTSGEANMKSLSYGNLNAVLIKAIQEQQTIIESLTARITTLEG